MRRADKTGTRLVREDQFRLGQLKAAIFDERSEGRRNGGGLATFRQADLAEHRRAPDFEAETGAASVREFVSRLAVGGKQDGPPAHDRAVEWLVVLVAKNGELDG